jgi:hypothetical protein
MRKLAIASAAVAAIGVPAAHATPGNGWLVSTKNWTCLYAPEADEPYHLHLNAKSEGIREEGQVIAKKPDGSPRAMVQNLYQKDGTVTPLFWFADKADYEDWLAQLRKKGLAKPNPAKE